MNILFIGENFDYLKALAESVGSSHQKTVLDLSLHPLSGGNTGNPEIIITDIASCTNDLKVFLDQVRITYPSALIWGIFNYKSIVLHESLRKMHITKLISHQDDLDDLLNDL
ncbi:MAG: hypothetical protein WDZ35_06530 [Crocinitomicaceae bacterium]